MDHFKRSSILKTLSIILFFECFFISSINAQEHGFEFGKIGIRELQHQQYPLDTTASAIVLYEFGEAHIDNENDHNLIFEYHVKIKILKKEGTKEANYEIALRKNNSSRKEILKSVKASSFNLASDGNVQETKLQQKNVFTKQLNQHFDIVTFAIPAVREESIIEIFYVLESPFIYNFRTWTFQSHLPKLLSEYWALIPANYRYNISLRGYLALEKSESELVKDCFSPGGGRLADCGRYKYAMRNIPGFKEEKYMTAPSNYISAINFELEEVQYFNGNKDKISKEWKDVEDELLHNENFGIQIKRAQNFLNEQVTPLVIGETDHLKKIKKIYEFIKTSIQWNGSYGMFCDVGIKKAFESKKGNVADINLALVSAIKSVGIAVEPMILSTRANGEVIDLFPVISDFNYVVAKVTIQDKVYLLDATDPYLPFSLVPTQCLNGKGRAFNEEGSYWYEIKASQKEKTLSNYILNLQDDGSITGTVTITYFGYEAAKRRKQINKFNSENDYVKDLQQVWDAVQISEFEIINLAAVEESLRERFEIRIEPNDFNGGNILFYPFFNNGWKNNPFPSEHRIYPVDFGAPLEETTLLSFSYPKKYVLSELPKNIGLTLPNAGGRLILSTQQKDNWFSFSFSLALGKTVFTAEEYHYLRELFNVTVSIQNAPLLFLRQKE